MSEGGTVFASGETLNAFQFNLNELNVDEIYITLELVSDPNPYQAPVTYNCTSHPGDLLTNVATSFPLVVNGLPMKYHHGEVNAQFDISSPASFASESMEFDLTLSATWVFNDGSTVPVGMIEERTETLKLDNHLDGSRITKKWQIRAVNEDGTQSQSNFGFLPDGKMLFTIVNNATDTVTVNNIIVTASFYFSVGVYI